MPTAFPLKMKDVADALASGRSDKINGAEITISKAWCSRGYQVGVGLDETGRKVAFSISLRTGQGLAAPL